MLFELRLALRALRRAPTFTATAVLTLTLGIGGTTATFGLVDAVLLRPLPFRDPDRLVQIWESQPSEHNDRFAVAAANFADWQTQTQSFDGLALFDSDVGRSVIATPAGPVQTRDVDASSNLFGVLGVRPLLGQGFKQEAATSVPREVVLSHQLWRSAFDADPTIVGKPVRIEGRSSYVVVGVMPPGFSFPGKTELWVAMTDRSLADRRRDGRFFEAIGRLKAGIGLERARAELQMVAQQLAREHPATNGGWTVAVAPLEEAISGASRLALVTLLGAVLFVLLVGCMNVVNLLLARGVSRRSELAVRAALGASRGRIVRQLLTESLVLASCGGAIGWLLAVWSLPVLVRLIGDAVPRLVQARLNATALVFCAGVSIVTTLVIGLVPALSASRVDVHIATQSDGERATAAAGQARLQRWFVAAELAVSLVLIVGALLLVQTFVRLRRIDPGFDPAHVISIDLRVPIFRSTTANKWFLLANESRMLLARLGAVPGVESVATTSDVPLTGDALTTSVTIRLASSRSPQLSESPHLALYHRVSGGYFRTMGMPIVEGRDFVDADTSSEEQLTNARAPSRDGAVIVNERTAKQFWPAGDALGQYLSTSFDRVTTRRRRVVGIVRDARSEALRTAPPAELYVPYLEDPSFAMTMLVRTELEPDRIVPALRGQMGKIDPDLSAANIRTVDDIVTESIGSARSSTFIVGAFASVALLLSGIGVCGVVAFGVTGRVREIGIRMALGADAVDIVRLFLTQMAMAMGTGVLAGIAGALTLTRLLSSLLFGVTPTDPATFAASALLLMAVALMAGYIPVRAALRMDPVNALRRL